MNERVRKVKIHFRENKATYIAFGGGVALAGITCLLMRSRISPAIGGTAGSAIGGTGESVVSSFVAPTTIAGKTTINLSQVIEANRQGPPSWVVRCLETGEVFTSQRAASLAKGVSEAHLSNHLNGVRDHVDDLHFERLCLAA